MLVQFEKTERGILIQLPDEFGESPVFETGNMVDISRENGHFIMSRPDEPHYDIEEMIATITDENRHEEISSGPSVSSPVRRSKYTTQELLKGVTDENIHGEVDWGPPVGKEVW